MQPRSSLIRDGLFLAASVVLGGFQLAGHRPIGDARQAMQETASPPSPTPTETVAPITDLTPTPVETSTEEGVPTATPSPLPTPSQPPIVLQADLSPGEILLQPQGLLGVESADVLYDQTDHPDTTPPTGVSSQNFEPSWDAYDDEAADDFVIPSDVFAWTINSIEVMGFYPGSHEREAGSVNVRFYEDLEGLPGREVYAATGVVPVSGSDTGNFVMHLDTPVRLLGGHYWISVQANLDIVGGGQWAWQKRDVQSYSESAWRNPGDGFGSGCTQWAPRISGGCGFSPGPDMLFRLRGVSETILPPSPTLSVYVNSRAEDDLYSFGLQLGQVPAKGVVILDFGKPLVRGGQYGTMLFDGIFVPAFDPSGEQRPTVYSLAVAFLRGWEDGFWASDAHLRDPFAYLHVVIGTSNCGYLSNSFSTVNPSKICIPTYPDDTNMPPEHGAAWAQLVSALLQYVLRVGYSPEMSIFAGSDIELAWNRPAVTLAWLDGYVSYFEGVEPPSIVLFDFGACEGCSYVDVQGDVCTACVTIQHSTEIRRWSGGKIVDQWTETWTWDLHDVLYKAAGTGLNLPIPEIYSTNGTHARQWYGLSRYSLDTIQLPIQFLGVLTQCASEADSCAARSDGNTPLEAWLQMLDWLSRDPRTRALSLSWLTSINYLTDPKVCFDC